MSDNEKDGTQPGSNHFASQSNQEKPGFQNNLSISGVKRQFPHWLVAVVVIIILIIGSLAGYASGLGSRYDAERTQVAGQLQEQFELGMEAMNTGQYEVAKQHFEFIIENDPNYAGVLDAYADLLLLMQTSPTPTSTATTTITLTPDFRGVEAIYANVLQALSSRDWDTALTNLDSLRKTDPTYKTAEVDGLYYLALRMRGVGKIILQEGETCPDINLEGGIYDLTLAERFGTLDAISESLRTFSRLYIIGASYWDQDWEQAQFYFDQVRLGNPNLRDSSCMSATERWRFATIKRAEEMVVAGDYCAAEEQYNLAFTVSSDKNEGYYPTATEISIQCDGDGGGEGVTPDGTPTETPSATPTETPTP